MTDLSQALSRFFGSLGFPNFSGEQFVMVLLALALLLAALLRRRPAILLAVLGFGILAGNMPFSPVEEAWTASAEGYGLLSVLRFLLGPNLLPALVFLGIGLTTDFSPLIASPRQAILGAAAQVGIFAAIFLGHFLLPLNQSAVAAAAGSAHPLMAVYAAAALDPALLASSTLAALAAGWLAPGLIERLAAVLTTPAERALRMAPPRAVSPRLRLLFPVIGLIVCLALVPAVRVPLAMLFLGSLVRSGMGWPVHRITRFGRGLIALLSGVLAFGIGLVTSGGVFLAWRTLGVFLIALAGLLLAAGWGILMAKLMNLFTSRKVNPLLGAAALLPAPHGARLAQRLAADEDPDNHFLAQALAPNLAAQIALLLTLGIAIGMLA